MTNPLRMSRARKAHKLTEERSKPNRSRLYWWWMRALRSRGIWPWKILTGEAPIPDDVPDWIRDNIEVQRLEYEARDIMFKARSEVERDRRIMWRDAFSGQPDTTPEEVVKTAPPPMDDRKYPPSWNPLKWRWFDHNV